MQGQQAAKSGVDSAYGQAKGGIDQAASTAASQVCVAFCLCLYTMTSSSSNLEGGQRVGLGVGTYGHVQRACIRQLSMLCRALGPPCSPPMTSG